MHQEFPLPPLEIRLLPFTSKLAVISFIVNSITHSSASLFCSLNSLILSLSLAFSRVLSLSLSFSHSATLSARASVPLSATLEQSSNHSIFNQTIKNQATS
jgi:hypothetical protein